MPFKNNCKPRFRVCKIDINTGKNRCGVVKHFLTKIINVKTELQLIKQLEEDNFDGEGKL